MASMNARGARRNTVRDGFDKVIVALMALGAVVFVEPAPFDLLIILLLPVALLLRRLAIPTSSALAIVCVALFVLANVASLATARELGIALRFTAITLYLIVAWVFVLGIAGHLGERATRLVMLGWTIGAVLTTALAIASYFGLLPLPDLTRNNRLHALFKDANVLGAYLVAPAVWSVAQLVALERGPRLAWAGALVVCGAGILLTYSRGAWISVAVAMMVFFGLRMAGRSSVRARVMTLLAVPVAAVLLALAIDRLAEVDFVHELLTQRLGPQSYDTHRFATQREALELAARRPLGIGPGQSEHTFMRAAHNTYVRTLVENGYLGGLTMAALMFVSTLRACWMAMSAHDPRLSLAMAVVTGSLAAICVESIVIDTIHWRHLWVLAALAWTPDRGPGRASPAAEPRSALVTSRRPR